MLNGEILKAFPLWAGARQEFLLSLFVFNKILIVFAREIRQEGKKGIQIGKEKIKLSLQVK